MLPKKKFRYRSASRLACIQILYNSLLIEKDIEIIIDNYNDSFLDDLKNMFDIDEKDEKFFYRIIDEVKFNKDKIINIIADNLNPNWTYERLGIVEKSILIVGISEIRTMDITPINSVISEYVEFCFQLGGDSSFVNKILDIISKFER